MPRRSGNRLFPHGTTDQTVFKKIKKMWYGRPDLNRHGLSAQAF